MFLPSLGSAPQREHYLPHLDGIRFIALAGVLSFHFNVPLCESGFLGVDIFLTLSGFLITCNILRDIDLGRHSLRNFYVRRIFRLYPSATLTALVSVCFAFFTFPAGLAYETALSALASMAFSSNLYFHSKDKYFSAASDLKPLLHTWSLSLEEQFYLLWPLLVMFLTSNAVMRKRSFAVISFSTAASMAFALNFQPTKPSLVFFELPARFFQFSVGSLLAFYQHRGTSSEHEFPQPPSQTARLSNSPPDSKGMLKWDKLDRPVVTKPSAEILHMFALALSVLSFFLPQKSTSVIVNILISLATVVQVHSKSTRTSKLFLESWVPTTLGKLSYSAYLIHWPLYVFLNHVFLALQIEKPGPFLLSFLTVISAVLMRQVVEEPLRSPKSLRNMFVLLLLVLVTAIMSAVGAISAGFVFRFDEDSKMLAAGNARGEHEQEAYTAKLKSICNYDKCKTLIHPSERSFICCAGDIENGIRAPYTLFGDSFARHDAPALNIVGKRNGVWFPIYSQIGCPVRGTPKLPPEAKIEGCNEKRLELYEVMKKLPENNTVLLSNNWAFDSRQQVLSTFRGMTDETNQLGYKVLFMGEQPGLASSEASLFHARDLAALPLGRLLGLSSSKHMNYSESRCAKLGSASCAPRSRLFRPIRVRLRQYRWYTNIFNNELKKERFMDRFTPLCNRKNMADPEAKCIAPVNDNAVSLDVGYLRDRYHVDWSGSEWYADLFEKELFGTPN